MHCVCAFVCRSFPVLQSQGWFLTDFAAALAIVGAYLVLATVGPKIMEGKEPIDSYPVRFVYNVVQVMRLAGFCCHVQRLSPCRRT